MSPALTVDAGPVVASTPGIGLSTPEERLARILDRLDAAAPTNIGFPVASDIDFRVFAPFLGHLLNNVGDPRSGSTYPGHVKDVEREVLDWFAGIFRAPAGWSGYLTSGGTEGTNHSLLAARTALPDAVLYYARSAHYSVPKAAALLGLPAIGVDVAPHGEMDYVSLRQHLSRNRRQPAIVVATVGSTMTEAVDSVPAIHQTLDATGIAKRWVHADAALSGVPYALTGQGTEFDLSAGSDSISVSGHKFFGVPIPCGVTLCARPAARPGAAVSYIGSHDNTISGSRSGLAALMLWYAITRYGHAGHRQRAHHARDVAEYACYRLTALGWPSWRNRCALTVMLQPLPSSLAARWPLPVEHGWSHLICMPGVTRRHIDHLATDLLAVL